ARPTSRDAARPSTEPAPTSWRCWSDLFPQFFRENAPPREPEIGTPRVPRRLVWPTRAARLIRQPRRRPTGPWRRLWPPPSARTRPRRPPGRLGPPPPTAGGPYA